VEKIVLFTTHLFNYMILKNLILIVQLNKKKLQVYPEDKLMNHEIRVIKVSLLFVTSG
jgi:hypothetical protein